MSRGPGPAGNVAQGAYHAHRAAHEVALGFSPDPTVRYLQACVYHGAAFALGLLRPGGPVAPLTPEEGWGSVRVWVGVGGG